MHPYLDSHYFLETCFAAFFTLPRSIEALQGDAVGDRCRVVAGSDSAVTSGGASYTEDAGHGSDSAGVSANGDIVYLI